MNTGLPAPGALKAPSGAPTHPARALAAGPALSTLPLRIMTVFPALRRPGGLPRTAHFFTICVRSEWLCR